MKKTFFALIFAYIVTEGTEAQVQVNSALVGVTPTGAIGTAGKTPDLPRFDFEFKGGSPKELVDALNVPLKGSLNVIIPDDSDRAQIPPIKVKDANVQQIFEALARASQKTVYWPVQQGARKIFQSGVEQIAFQPTLPVGENSVWSFQIMGQRPPPSVGDSVRFYQLGPYLDGLKVDDIVTAIQTASTMLKNSSAPQLKFHPETQLLIAVGQEGDFALIDAALLQLPKKRTEARMDPASASVVEQQNGPRPGTNPPSVK